MIWKAKTLTDRGPSAQERQIGADFAGVLDADLPGMKVKKGFLVQAKLLRDGQMSRNEFGRMRDQCKQMLDISEACYVFTYSSSGIRVIPARNIMEASDTDALFSPGAAGSSTVKTFFERHLRCQIGDQQINEASYRMLSELRARSLLSLTVRLRK